MPTNEDALQSRTRTSGMKESLFEFGQFNYHVFDVGGAYSKRNGWIYNLAEVYYLVFLVPLSGYYQCLVEKKNEVRILIVSILQTRKVESRVTVVN